MTRKLRRLATRARSASVVALSLVALLAAAPASPAPAGNGSIAFVLQRAPSAGTGVMLLDDRGFSDVDHVHGHGSPVAWSRDGERLAYRVSNYPLTPLVRIRAADGSTLDLTVPPDPQSLVWSPDGRRLALRARHLDQQVLLLAATDGSGVRMLGVTGSAEPSWSPDSTIVAHASWFPDPGARDGLRLGVALENAGREESRVLPLPSHLDVSNGPAFSPDGRELALGLAPRDHGAPTLHVVGIDGRGRRELSPLDLLPGSVPRWSPDGSRLLVAGGGARSPDAHLPDIYVVMRAGGTRRLTSTRASFRRNVRAGEDELVGVESFNPHWSPDGTKVLFARGIGEALGTDVSPYDAGHELYVMNGDGTCETPLVGRATLTRGRERLVLWGSQFDWQPRPGLAPSPPLECADLGVHVTLRSAPLQGWGPRLYTVRVSNDGTHAADDVRLVGTLDASLAGDVLSPRGRCATTGTGITCRLGRIAPRRSVDVVFRVTGTALGARPGRFQLGSARRVDRHEDNDRAGIDWRVTRCSPDSPPAGSLIGTSAAELLCGGEGRDRIVALAGDDRIRAGAGDDVVRAGAGDDDVYAGPGADLVFPGPGRDRIDAGPGNDVIRAADGERDIISCGPGRDRVVADRRDVVARDCETVVRR